MSENAKRSDGDRNWIEPKAGEVWSPGSDPTARIRVVYCDPAWVKDERLIIFDVIEAPSGFVEGQRVTWSLRRFQQWGYSSNASRLPLVRPFTDATRDQILRHRLATCEEPSE